jgi:succinoglycan biosynthesis protein ExoA
MTDASTETPGATSPQGAHAPVTVVIPARDEEGAIGACLGSVLAQSYEDLQVIVVDGASRDGTAAVVEEVRSRDGRVELVYNPRGIIPVSLNRALARAQGRWLVRVDAHAQVPSDYVARAVAHLATGRWGGVGGRKDGVGQTAAGRAIAAAMGSPFGVGNSAYHYAQRPQVVDHVPFGAYPVELARRLGGWDERLRVNEDFEFDHRVREAGYELLLDPAMVIDWECRQSLGALFRQYRRYGAGKTAVARLHPGSVRLRHLAAPALVGSWVVALGLLVRRRPAAAAGVVAPYLGLLGVASWRVGRRLEAGSRRYVPGAFVAMHAGWGLGFWRGLVSTWRRADLAGTPPAPTDLTQEGSAHERVA